MLIFISEPTLIIHWMWAFLRPQMLKLMKISALIWRYFDRCSGRSLSDASTHFPLCGCRLAWFLSIKNISYPIFTKQKWHPTAGRKLFSKWRIWLCMNSCSTKSLSTRLNISLWCFTFRHSSNVYCHSWLCFRLLLTDMLLVFFLVHKCQVMLWTNDLNPCVTHQSGHRGGGAAARSRDLQL